MLPSLLRAAVVFLLSFGVYLGTCARDVTLVDSGELILAAAGLGVAHAPGFPLYTALGFLFSKLPVGTVAFRLALMSGFFGALTAALVSHLVSVLFGQRRGLGDLAAVASGLLYALAATPWFFATVAEVYTLHTALLAATFWLAFSWRRQYLESGGGRRPRVLALACGLCFGLALCVHHVTAVLAVPALLFLAVATVGRNRGILPYLGMGLAGTIMGLLPYAYLPLAASADPIINWGDPSSWHGFIDHVTAKQYRVNLFSGERGALGRHFQEFLASLTGQFTWLGFLVVLAGVALCWRKDRIALGFFALLALFGVGYALNYDIAEDQEAYYLVTIMGAAVMAGATLTRISSGGHKTPLARTLAALLLLVLPAINAVAHWRANDRRLDQTARIFAEDTVSGIGPGGVLLTQEWQLYAPFLYLHHLEGFRSDLQVIDANLVRRSWYVRTYLNRTYPKLLASCGRQRDSYLRLLERWEGGLPFDEGELTGRFRIFLSCLLMDGSQGHLTLPMEAGVGDGNAWVPWGLTMAVKMPPGGLGQDPPDLRFRELLRRTQYVEPVARTKVLPAYVIMLANRARFLALQGRFQEAERLLESAEEIDPQHEVVVETRAGLEDLRNRD